MSKIMYSKTHEWVSIDGDKAKIGLTDYAQKELGDLVYIGLPEEGKSLTAGGILCDVESVKAVSDIYSPVSGTVTAVNEELEGAPESINSDPMRAWICEVSIESLGDLMDEDAYQKFLKG